MSRILTFSAFVAFLLMTIHSVSAKAAPVARKNFCSMTINSSDEIDAFKKNLSPDLWNFIELTQADASANWLQKACAQKISCDVLVVSGHFGGTFFGSSGKYLSVETLERASCNSDCDGILKKPREVFLFGCNTLAGKDQDHRSPEEYRRVLMEDGFSSEQAEQVVAFRYSEYGNSFRNRMQDVFSGVPRIYGFYSVAPLGRNVRGSLNNYLSKNQSSYNNTDAISSSIEPNKNLLAAMSNYTFKQVAGSDSAQNDFERPYCYLENKAVPREQKLEYIRTALLSERSLSFIPYVEQFVRSLRFDLNAFSSHEKSLLNDLETNDALKNNFDRILTLKGDMYLKVRVDTLNLMRGLQILSQDDFESKRARLLADIDLSTPFTYQKKDLLCSLGVETNWAFAKIPEARWNDVNFIATLGCLRTTEAKTQGRLLQIYLNGSSTEEIRKITFNTLMRSGITSEDVLKSIALALGSDVNPDNRRAMAMLLSTAEEPPMDVLIQLAKSVVNDKDKIPRETAAYALKRIAPSEKAIRKYLEANRDKAVDPKTVDNVMDILVLKF